LTLRGERRKVLVQIVELMRRRRIRWRALAEWVDRESRSVGADHRNATDTL